MDGSITRDLMSRLNQDAARLARRFGLEYRSLTAERAGVNGHYGICYSDGAIKIRVRHAVSGRPLKYSSLVNTLCHELAHLRHFNHGPRFKAFYLEILEFARAEGIYRPRTAAAARRREPKAAPRRRKAPGPEQLDLFGGGGR